MWALRQLRRGENSLGWEIISPSWIRRAAGWWAGRNIWYLNLKSKTPRLAGQECLEVLDTYYGQAAHLLT